MSTHPAESTSAGGFNLLSVGLALAVLVWMSLATSVADTEGLRAPPVLSVAQTDQPPNVDGSLDDPAWQNAAGFTGFTPIGSDELSPYKTTVAATYTQDRLFVAYACPFAPHEKLEGAVRERDTGSPWHEDSLEIFLSPDPESPDDCYQLIGNWAGSIYDVHAGDRKWNGNWEFKTKAGEGLWTAEVSIPFADLGTSSPQPGDTWRANFCRDVVAGRSAFETWADTGASYMTFSQFGHLQFVGRGPVAMNDFPTADNDQLPRYAVVIAAPGDRLAIPHLADYAR